MRFYLLILVVTIAAPFVGRDVIEQQVEVVRVGHHIDGALMLLRSADTSQLSTDQLASRQEIIAWLEEYRAEGVYPHNHVVSGRRTPVFVDPHGTPCAVGYLMLRSGEHALVADIVAKSNLAKVGELATDDRVIAWLARYGLSSAEAARIQPNYGEYPRPRPDRGSSKYADETVGLAIFSVAIGAYSEFYDRGSSPWPGIASVVGVAGHGLVLGSLLTNDVSRSTWEVPVNLAGIAIGTTALILRSRRSNRANGRDLRSSLLPTVLPSRDGIQLAVSVRL